MFQACTMELLEFVLFVTSTIWKGASKEETNIKIVSYHPNGNNAEGALRRLANLSYSCNMLPFVSKISKPNACIMPSNTVCGCSDEATVLNLLLFLNQHSQAHITSTRDCHNNWRSVSSLHFSRYLLLSRVSIPYTNMLRKAQMLSVLSPSCVHLNWDQRSTEKSQIFANQSEMNTEGTSPAQLCKRENTRINLGWVIIASSYEQVSIIICNFTHDFMCIPTCILGVRMNGAPIMSHFGSMLCLV